GDSAERVAELLAELVGEFGVAETLVLRARVLDLQRAHQRGDAADGRPVHVAHEAEDESRTVGVAATGRIDDAALLRGRDRVRLAADVDGRAFRALRDDVRLDALGDLGRAPAGALLQQLRFVVVDD